MCALEGAKASLRTWKVSSKAPFWPYFVTKTFFGPDRLPPLSHTVTPKFA